MLVGGWIVDRVLDCHFAASPSPGSTCHGASPLYFGPAKGSCTMQFGRRRLSCPSASLSTFRLHTGTCVLMYESQTLHVRRFHVLRTEHSHQSSRTRADPPPAPAVGGTSAARSRNVRSSKGRVSIDSTRFHAESIPSIDLEGQLNGLDREALCQTVCGARG